MMLNFAKRILLAAIRFLPFASPVRKVSQNIEVAAPVAVSPVGQPHLILASIVPFAFIMEGAYAAMLASFIAAGMEVFVLAVKQEKHSREWKLAMGFSVVYLMCALAIAQTEWLLS